VSLISKGLPETGPSPTEVIIVKAMKAFSQLVQWKTQQMRLVFDFGMQ
jgi:hypothetical protein